MNSEAQDIEPLIFELVKHFMVLMNAVNGAAK